MNYIIKREFYKVLFLLALFCLFPHKTFGDMYNTITALDSVLSKGKNIAIIMYDLYHRSLYSYPADEVQRVLEYQQDLLEYYSEPQPDGWGKIFVLHIDSITNITEGGGLLPGIRDRLYMKELISHLYRGHPDFILDPGEEYIVIYSGVETNAYNEEIYKKHYLTRNTVHDVFIMGRGDGPMVPEHGGASTGEASPNLVPTLNAEANRLLEENYNVYVDDDLNFHPEIAPNMTDEHAVISKRSVSQGRWEATRETYRDSFHLLTKEPQRCDES